MDIISVLASTGPFALLLVGLVVFVENEGHGKASRRAGGFAGIETRSADDSE